MVCSRAISGAFKTPVYGIALFPDAPFTEQWGFGTEEQDMEISNRETPGYIYFPSIVVCIAYRPVFDNTSVYATVYVFDLLKLDSANRPSGVFKIGEVIDREHLTLRWHPSIAISAN
jgi:hypothetical protein